MTETNETGNLPARPLTISTASNHSPPMAKKSPGLDLNEHAKALIAGLQSIPVSELVACARDNLTATRRIRLSKDDPEGTEEPDYATRQKALQFITEQCAGAAGTRKPLEAAVDPDSIKPSIGLLRPDTRKPKNPDASENRVQDAVQSEPGSEG